MPTIARPKLGQCLGCLTSTCRHCGTPIIRATQTSPWLHGTIAELGSTLCVPSVTRTRPMAKGVKWL